ncbi:MAG: NIPSNAP family protein [Bacteroidales bacterium]
MKRRDFIRSVSIGAAATLAPMAMATPRELKGIAYEEKQMYEWQVYSLSRGAAQLDNYFQRVLIPYLNRFGVKVGAFSSYGLETPSKQFYLLAYPNASVYYSLKHSMWKDDSFLKEAKPYFDETASAPIYTNVEISLCEAFDALPQFRQPAAERGLFEFRVYWSPNEEANQRKIHMFNNGEIDIFDAVKVNSVFYGEILAGPRMNALMYMTWFKDMASRDEAWKKFSAHPDWKRMSGMEQYKNTATNNTRIFLLPLSYSQL